MDLLRDSILCVLFPPSLKALGPVTSTVLYSEAVQKKLAEPQAKSFDGTGETTTYQLRVPDNVVARKLEERDLVYAGV